MVDLVIWLIVGAAAGWIAGIVVKGAGLGPLGNIIVGINCRWLHLPITGHCFSTGVDRGRRLCRDRGHHTTSCRILVQASLNEPQRAGREVFSSHVMRALSRRFGLAVPLAVL